MSELFGVAAGIIGILGYIPYIKDILRGSTRPDRVAWLIWTFEYMALFFAQMLEGASHSLWLIGLQLLGVIVVFSLSLRRGFGHFTTQARLLLASVFLALLIWWLTKNGALAILILLAIEGLGVGLTVRKTFMHPGSETLTMWICVGIGGALGTLAVGVNGTPVLYAYPLALIVMSGSVIAASLLGSRRRGTTPITDTP